MDVGRKGAPKKEPMFATRHLYFNYRKKRIVQYVMKVLSSDNDENARFVCDFLLLSPMLGVVLTC